MLRRGAKQLSLVELLVIFTIAGILLSILLPALFQGRGRSHRPGPGAETATPGAPSSEGVFNTIDPPQTAKRTDPGAASGRSPTSGWLVQLLVIAAVLRVVMALRKRGLRPRLQRPQRKHPPEEE